MRVAGRRRHLTGGQHRRDPGADAGEHRHVQREGRRAVEDAVTPAHHDIELAAVVPRVDDDAFACRAFARRDAEERTQRRAGVAIRIGERGGVGECSGIRESRRVRKCGRIRKCCRIGEGRGIGKRGRVGESSGIDEGIRVGKGRGVGECGRVRKGGGIGERSRIGKGRGVGERSGIGEGRRIDEGTRRHLCAQLCQVDRCGNPVVGRLDIGVQGQIVVRRQVGQIDDNLAAGLHGKLEPARLARAIQVLPRRRREHARPALQRKGQRLVP